MTIRDFGALMRQWSELEAAGIPLEPLENRVGIDTRASGAGLTIRVGRDRSHGEIRELKNGSFAYILPVFVRRNLPGKTVIRDRWIEPPWPEPVITLLEDPQNERRPSGDYAFPGDTYRYAREEVLNHRLSCELSRGDSRDGLLLGIGLRPPETYKNRFKIEVTFCVLDQWDIEHTAKLQMQINRLPLRAKEINKNTRGPLLSRRDVIVPGCSLVVPPGPTEESRKKDEEARRRMEEEVARFHSKIERAKVPVGPKTGYHSRRALGV